ncbi:TPA: hypothetical protein ACJOLN_000672 [Streptococcus pyogenes]
MNYLEYALAYLERELEIIDNDVIEVELPNGGWEFVPNPYYEESSNRKSTPKLCSFTRA